MSAESSHGAYDGFELSSGTVEVDQWVVNAQFGRVRSFYDTANLVGH
jgi:hypothetical protein